MADMADQVSSLADCVDKYNKLVVDYNKMLGKETCLIAYTIALQIKQQYPESEKVLNAAEALLAGFLQVSQSTRKKANETNAIRAVISIYRDVRAHIKQSPAETQAIIKEITGQSPEILIDLIDELIDSVHTYWHDTQVAQQEEDDRLFFPSEKS